jgi:hypothetical protein
MRLKPAVDALRKALRNDPELWNAYQANIAMAFIDEYSNYQDKHRKRIKMHGLKYEELHAMANQAASRFLDNLTR